MKILNISIIDMDDKHRLYFYQLSDTGICGIHKYSHVKMMECIHNEFEIMWLSFMTDVTYSY